MKIAELFVGLGIKGDDDAGKKLKNVDKGLKDVQSTGYAAKAALLAVVYGVGQLIGASAKAGTELANFTDLTGISSTKLQQYQYVLRQVGGTNEEMEQTFKNVSSAIANMLLTGDAPKFAGFFSSEGIDVDMNRVEDTIYMMEKLQELSKSLSSHGHPAVANEILKSLGVDGNVAVAMKKGMFNASNFANAPIIGEQQLERLRRLNAEYGNFQKRLSMTGSQLALSVGSPALKELNHAFTSVEHFSTALGKLVKQQPAIGYILTALGGIAALTFAPVTASIVLLIETLADLDKGKDSAIRKSLKGYHKLDQNIMEFLLNKIGGGLEMMGATPRKTEDLMKDIYGNDRNKPFMGPTQEKGTMNIQKIEINAPGGDPEAIRDSTTSAIDIAYSQYFGRGAAT